VHQLFIDLKIAYASRRREVLCNIVIEFGILLNLVIVMKMCPNGMYSRIRVGKHLSDMFNVRNGLKKRRFVIALTLNFYFFFAFHFWCLSLILILSADRTLKKKLVFLNTN